MEIGLVLAVLAILHWYVQRVRAASVDLVKLLTQQRKDAVELVGLGEEAKTEWTDAYNQRAAVVHLLGALLKGAIPRAVVRHARNAVARGSPERLAMVFEHQDAIEEFIGYQGNLTEDESDREKIRAIDDALHSVDEGFTSVARGADEWTPFDSRQLNEVGHVRLQGDLGATVLLATFRRVFD